MDVMSSFMMPAREPLLPSSSPSIGRFGLYHGGVARLQAAPQPIRRRLEVEAPGVDEVTFAPGGSWLYDPESVSLSPIERRSVSPSSMRRTVNQFIAPARYLQTDAIRGQLSPPRVSFVDSGSTTPSRREEHGLASLLAARSPASAVNSNRYPQQGPELRIPAAPTSSQNADAIALDAVLDAGPSIEATHDAMHVIVKWACATCPLNDVLRLPVTHKHIRFCPQCGTKQPAGDR